jgi:Ran GTPase-activating protein (RanGAP) involved in mRNA processing and transport
LDLGFNWLGDEEVQDICEGLCKNTALRELNLYGCHRISNKGLKTILRCLKQHNTSLHKIGLQAFDEEGKRIIEEISYWVKLNRAGRYLIKSCLAPSAISSEQDNQSNDQQLFVQSGDSVAPAPMALWPRALEKSNKDPDPIYHLVREGFVLNQR